MYDFLWIDSGEFPAKVWSLWKTDTDDSSHTSFTNTSSIHVYVQTA